MISFSEGLGALESQMLVYKKVYQGPVSIEKPDPRELYLGGLAVHWGESPAQKPRGIRN